MTNDWVVVLEVVRGPLATPVDADVLRRLLKLLCEAEPEGAQPLALVADDRYALHLSVTAASIPEAIVIALVRWENLSSRVGLDGWDPRRAEVITRADFDQEAQTIIGDGWRLVEPPSGAS